MRKGLVRLAVLAAAATTIIMALAPAAQSSSSGTADGVKAVPQTWCATADKYGAATYEQPSKRSTPLEPLAPNSFVSGTMVTGDPIGGDNRWLYVSTEYRRFHVAFNDLTALRTC